MATKQLDPLRSLRLVPPSLEAALPDHIHTSAARGTVTRLTKKINSLAEALAAHPWLADVTLSDRAGSVGTDFAGALELLRQATLSLDLAVDARLLRQRREAGERMSRVMAMKREAHLGEAGSDD